MSEYTPNLNLFKYNTSTDGKEVFSIAQALNHNWDILDNMDLLPDQTDKAGYVLTTDGAEASWGQTGEIYPVIETYINGTSWYRVYSDGWCEQSGVATCNTSGEGTITFLKPFVNTDYFFICDIGRRNDSSTWHIYPSFTYSGTTMHLKANITGYTLYTRWQACGYIEV